MPYSDSQLLAVLNEIKGSGTFVSSGTQSFGFPGLQISGLEEISFPVNTSQIRELIQTAYKAPFGKGSKTVLDTKVRSAWEIDAEKSVLRIHIGKNFLMVIRFFYITKNLIIDY